MEFDLNITESVSQLYDDCDLYAIYNMSESDMLLHYMGPRRMPLARLVPWTMVLALLLLTGVLGNVCVCVVIARHPLMHTPTNYYLFSLAVSDLLLLLLGIPNEMSVYWHQYPYKLGVTFCKLRAFLSEAASYASVLTISAFSLERYLAICHPLLLHAIAGLRRASSITCVLWAVSGLCAMPVAVFMDVTYKQYPPNSGNISLDSAFCELRTPSPLLELSSIIFFMVPSIFILLLYIRMGIRIRSSRVSDKSKTGTLRGVTGRIHGEGTQAKSRKAVVRMLAAVVIAFVVCWAPFHLQRLFYVYGKELCGFSSINEHLFNVTGVLYYVSATINPILYNVMSGRYRLAFREILLCNASPRAAAALANIDPASCRDVTTLNSSTNTSIKIFQRCDSKKLLTITKLKQTAYIKKTALSNDTNIDTIESLDTIASTNIGCKREDTSINFICNNCVFGHYSHKSKST